jgi:hypothetical protein
MGGKHIVTGKNNMNGYSRKRLPLQRAINDHSNFLFDTMMLNATFNKIYWWRKPEYMEKTTDLSQVTLRNSKHQTNISLLSRALYRTRQHYRRTVPSDNNRIISPELCKLLRGHIHCSWMYVNYT